MGYGIVMMAACHTQLNLKLHSNAGYSRLVCKLHRRCSPCHYAWMLLLCLSFMQMQASLLARTGIPRQRWPGSLPSDIVLTVSFRQTVDRLR